MGAQNPLRARAEQVLAGSGRAFLRCDRGSGLYVTNAALTQEQLSALVQAGFRAERQGALWRLFPGEGLREAVEAWLAEEADALRLPVFSEAQAEDWALLTEGVKRLELRADRAALDGYEKRLRQRAAECMRTGQGGGLLTLCSRLLSAIRNARQGAPSAPERRGQDEA